jgi:hypothetical protein
MHQTPPAAPDPYLDDAGLLRHGRRWVVIPDTQLGVLQLLLDRRETIVRTAEVVAAYASAGGCTRPSAVRTMLSRLGQRCRTVGLHLVTVRKRGVLLTVPRRALAPARIGLAR